MQHQSKQKAYGRKLTSSEPLAEVQRALLVVLVLHAPHPEAGGLLSLRKLREHYMSSWEIPTIAQCPALFLSANARHRTARAPTRPRGAAPPPPQLMCVVMRWGNDEGARNKEAKTRV